MKGLRLFLAASCAALACACGAPAVKAPPANPPPPPKLSDNIEIIDKEVVEGPEQDWLARTRIYIDNAFAGQTEEGPKSREKRWSGRVAEGNRLVRLERWTFPRVWDWVRAPEDRQPPERFVRVRPGMKSVLRVRFSDQGREHSLEISQVPQ